MYIYIYIIRSLEPSRSAVSYHEAREGYGQFYIYIYTYTYIYIYIYIYIYSSQRGSKKVDPTVESLTVSFQNVMFVFAAETLAICLRQYGHINNIFAFRI